MIKMNSSISSNNIEDKETLVIIIHDDAVEESFISNGIKRHNTDYNTSNSNDELKDSS